MEYRILPKGKNLIICEYQCKDMYPHHHTHLGTHAICTVLTHICVHMKSHTDTDMHVIIHHILYMHGHKCAEPHDFLADAVLKHGEV